MLGIRKTEEERAQAEKEDRQTTRQYVVMGIVMLVTSFLLPGVWWAILGTVSLLLMMWHDQD